MRSCLAVAAVVAALLSGSSTAHAAPAPGSSSPVVSPAAPPTAESGLFVLGPSFVYNSAYSSVHTAVFANRRRNGATFVAFLVMGMPRATWGKRFGVHVHTNSCGPDPKAAGPHYSYPAAPPSMPLAQREIWLDVAVAIGGWGLSTRLVTLPMPPGAHAHSVVLHALPTNQVTGEAGDRLMCTTADLGALSSGAPLLPGSDM